MPSRARWHARPSLCRRRRGSIRNSAPQRRFWMKPGTWRFTPSTCARNWSGSFPSTCTCGVSSMTLSRIPRWDFTFLGMQVVLEVLALAAFGFQYQLTKDPLLKQITRYIMADEARHVAFGVVSLREVYAGMTAAELRERQEFCFECALRMRDRFLAQEVWETLGLPVKECTEIMKRNPVQIEFRKALFSKVVPSVKKLGLLDFGDGWLRNKFGELGVLKY